MYKRPHLETFLSALSRLGQIVVFTAAERSYAEEVLRRLSRKNYFSGAFYREVRSRLDNTLKSCTIQGSGYVKDLRSLGCDLRRTVVIDDSPLTYSDNPENALPVAAWHKEEKGDRALLELLAGLCRVSFEGGDIRTELAKIRLR